jgi:hypothetical protein
MAAQFPVLSDKLIAFIESQQLFFVATAAADGRINLSPKGADTLRVLSETQLLWVNFTGSGNETAAHLRQTDRMTMMFCSFTEQPMILRCYGRARAYHPRDTQWQELAAQVPAHPSSRQLVLLDIDLVQTSCGFGVPFYECRGERDNMSKWLAQRSDTDIEAYWQEKNQLSIDGLPTGILQDDA